MPPIAPAVANAVFALTGTPVHKLPITGTPVHKLPMRVRRMTA